MTSGLVADVAQIVGRDYVLAGDVAAYRRDATEARGLVGTAEAVARPSTTLEVERLVSWCYTHDVPLVPRGGGTGFAGGCVPTGGELVIDLSRMNAVRSFEPLLWRAEVEAGVSTAAVHRRARENGLYFPPDPGAAEQSLIGGNVATNAGGPHAFKYGATGDWITGLEAVVAPGETIRVGGFFRKDVAGYDLKRLLIGSEGTLGIVTAAQLRFIPAPRARYALAAAFATLSDGCAALEALVGSGLVPAALEFLDQHTMRLAGRGFPQPGFAENAPFVILSEADGTDTEAAQLLAELRNVLNERALRIVGADTRRGIDALWRWRDGVSLAVEARAGGKVSEDIVVPLDRLRAAVEATHKIAARHQVPACAWGHAGDGNVHSTFLVNPRDKHAIERAAAAASELFAFAAGTGGSISGEHGVGLVKRGFLQLQWDARAVEIHRALKEAFDPKALFNPGKKAC